MGEAEDCQVAEVFQLLIRRWGTFAQFARLASIRLCRVPKVSKAEGSMSVDGKL